MNLKIKQQFDIDKQWKELIGDLFEEWVAFFVQDIAKEIDFTKAP